jgi:hypothetical protein
MKNAKSRRIPTLTAVGAAAVLTFAREQGIDEFERLERAVEILREAGYTWEQEPEVSTDEEGNPLLSWRVALLPFVEQSALYESFRLDEPWDSPHNKQLIPLMPSFYRAVGANPGEGKTNFLAITCPNCVFMRHPQLGVPRTTSREAHAAIIVEASANHAVVWTRPDDIDLSSGDTGLFESNLVSQQLYTDRWVVVAWSQHPEIGEGVTVEQLMALPNAIYNWGWFERSRRNPRPYDFLEDLPVRIADQYHFLRLFLLRGTNIVALHYERLAREFAEGVSPRVMLVDGGLLAELMIDHVVGVAVQRAGQWRACVQRQRLVYLYAQRQLQRHGLVHLSGQ